jgi:hypothetical protein
VVVSATYFPKPTIIFSFTTPQAPPLPSSSSSLPVRDTNVRVDPITMRGHVYVAVVGALCLLGLASAALPQEDVAAHMSNNPHGGPLVVLMRHGFSDHNVLMQKVEGWTLCAPKDLEVVLVGQAAVPEAVVAVATSGACVAVCLCDCLGLWCG